MLHWCPFQIIFYCCSSTVVSIFPPPLSPTPPAPTSHPQAYPPLALSMGPLYMLLDDSSTSFSPLSLSPLVTVILFFISMSLVIFCLLFVLLIRFCLCEWIKKTMVRLHNRILCTGFVMCL